MNQFTLLVIILVVFTYYGGSNVPKVLKDNKELLLGVVVGLVLCSFMGTRLEGGPGDPKKKPKEEPEEEVQQRVAEQFGELQQY